MKLQRIFIPGSEWIYFKLYTGTKTADYLLMNHIAPFVKKLKDHQFIDSFFFLRYTDPDFHIRLRLHLNDRSNYTYVFSEFHSFFAECIDNCVVSNIVCGTYMREVERYGINTMLLSEDVFHIDSNAILQLSFNHEQDGARWQLAMLLVDDMVTAFGFEKDSRSEFLLQLAQSFKKEFGFESNAYTKQLNDKYRSLRPQIEKVMKRQDEAFDIYPILENRKKELTLVSVKIDEVLKEYPQIARNSLASSYIHMSLNRLFRSKNRLSEMVVYDFLCRYYNSVNAREKYMGGK